MNRKAHWYFVLGGLILAIACVIAGCGGGGGTSLTSDTGVEAAGTLVAEEGLLAVRAVANGPNELNPNYANAFQVPSTYAVAVSRMELLKGEDDTTPYVIFNTGSVDDPEVITLSGAQPTQSFGENSEYPAAGTYTHVKIELVYQEMTINADLNDTHGYAAHKFRIYSSTSGEIQDGDVLLLIGNVYNWIKGGTMYPVTGPRPDMYDPGVLVQHEYAAQDATPDPYLFTAELPEPIVVPAIPTGKYRVSVDFNLNSSPEIPGSTGIFMWDDVTPDGQFKPAIDKTNGGDGNEFEAEANGPAQWTPLSPTITFSYTQE